MPYNIVNLLRYFDMVTDKVWFSYGNRYGRILKKAREHARALQIIEKMGKPDELPTR